jgi:hypothetical protein
MKTKSMRALFVVALASATVFVACKSSSSGTVPEGGTLGGGECTDPSACVGYGNPCYSSVTCTDGKCAFQLQPPGYALPDASQTPFDCSYVSCDNFGNIKKVPDDLDRPDAGPCLQVFCIDGEPHTPEPVPDGTSCGAGLVCISGSCGHGDGGVITDAGHD